MLDALWKLLCFISKCWTCLSTFVFYVKVLDMLEHRYVLFQSSWICLTTCVFYFKVLDRFEQLEFYLKFVYICRNLCVWSESAGYVWTLWSCIPMCWICLNTFVFYLKASGYVWNCACLISKCRMCNTLCFISKCLICLRTAVFYLKVLDTFENVFGLSQSAGYVWRLLWFISRRWN